MGEFKKRLAEKFSDSAVEVAEDMNAKGRLYIILSAFLYYHCDMDEGHSGQHYLKGLIEKTKEEFPHLKYIDNEDFWCEVTNTYELRKWFIKWFLESD